MTEIALAIGVMIMAGLLGGLLSHRFKLPMVTGYIVVGILLSPSVFNVIPQASIDRLEIFISIALGIIAYSIGSSLHTDTLRQLERSIAWITPLQGLGAWILTTLGVALSAIFILGISNSGFLSTAFPLAFIIGAIATATAPAAVIALVHEYRARGPLTTTLLSIVAVDDAIAIIVFSIAMGIAQPLAGLAGGFPWYEMLGVPLLEIAAAIAIGAVLAFALIYTARWLQSRPVVLAAVLGTIMLCVGIANLLEISEILANMVMGFIMVNKARREELTAVIDDIEDVIFAMFFVLAGLHFDILAMKTAGILGLVIVLARFGGKYLGTGAGARLAGSPRVVKNYLGLALVPAAGVSLGLALLAQSTFPSFGTLLFNAVLASVILNELIGPPLVKFAIFRAGEQSKKETTSA